MEKIYVYTVRLLLEAVPEVFRENNFSMKRGTVLKFFVQDIRRNHPKPRSESLGQAKPRGINRRARLLDCRPT